MTLQTTLHVVNQAIPELPFPRLLLGPPPHAYLVEGAQYPSIAMQSNNQTAFMKNIYCTYASVNYSQRVHSAGMLQLSLGAREASEIGKHLLPQPNTGLPLKKIFNEGIQVDSDSTSVGSINNESHKETQRRRKIGLANKGRIPWNKGRKHTAETRELIRQRTIEALRDPKVRKKMSEYPHAHSELSKARIGRALRRVWAKRLKWTRLKEKFYLKWEESIAEAARSGGDDQQELDWDSYDKIKAEMANQQLQWAADKAKARELAKLRAERAAKARAEKMERLAQKRKERDLKPKAREQTQKKIQRKSKEEKEELAISKELKLKERLTKIHKKKSMDAKISMQRNMVNGHHPTIEKLDLEFIRREKMRRAVSLADQIRAAKSKRVECVAGEAVTNSVVHPPVTWQKGEKDV
ncbi:PREDICTED: uncharacterized protein LOC104612140 [Nelumbo nucifera]|uniref:Uncharacterized protein LOC104612140 n=2 Tax=Nelumbo nucifera TaxID=4432 RepID=A0A1U8B9B9_NELNU|nr:PREDICTED: uncharacterized protein LOC104612140 [Nelumbo nucifera]DAD24840.1 TPA_asm: hypothetical protein HUJ06_026304 [Nelumbo nucifera]